MLADDDLASLHGKAAAIHQCRKELLPSALQVLIKGEDSCDNGTGVKQNGKKEGIRC